MEKYLKPTSSTSKDQRALPEKRQRGTTPPTERVKSKKFFPNPKTTRPEETPISNRFGSLPVDEEISDSFQNATRRQAVSNIPPIVVELNEVWTHMKVRDTIENYVKDFHMKFRGQKLIRVQCYSIKDHQHLREGLIKENVAFYTFTRKDEKLPKVVIKGLPKFMIDRVPQELAALGFPEATVSELKTLRPTECPPVLIHLPSGTNMVKLKQIKYLLNCSIEVERFKPARKPGTQCFRCQGFGHASRNCNRPPRCVKCTMPHPTWECTKKDRDTPAKCCNCNENHPANYTKCKERVKYLNLIESRRANLGRTVVPEPIRNKIYDTPSAQPQTWAQITRSGKGKKQASIPNTVTSHRPAEKSLVQPREQFQPQDRSNILKQAEPSQQATAPFSKNTHDSETLEMLEILSTIKSVKREFSKCESVMEKVMLILTHLGHYV